MFNKHPNFNGIVWKYSRTESTIEGLNAGDYVMGDLSTLGWVIVKAFHFVSGEKHLEFLSEFGRVIGSSPMRNWVSIQTLSIQGM